MSNTMVIKSLENSKLILRPFQIGDGEFMYKNWASDPIVTKYLRYEPHQNVETSNAIVLDFIEKNKSQNEFLWCIVLKENCQPIGSIGLLTTSKKDNVAEIGYNISRAYWNCGFMTACLKLVLKFAFENTSYNRVEAFHSILNPASGKVMQKAGMIFEGNSRQKYFSPNSGYQDTANYAILREDWVKQNERK